MRVSLIDINLFIALIWSNHVHHEAAHRWFSRNREHGWATCPLTEAGFVRISIQPAAVKRLVPFDDAYRALKLNVQVPGHEFWPLDYPLSEMQPEIQERVRGPQQLTDAILLDLAIRRNGRLATFDRRIENLLPIRSQYLDALEIIDPQIV